MLATPLIRSRGRSGLVVERRAPTIDPLRTETSLGCAVEAERSGDRDLLVVGHAGDLDIGPVRALFT